MSYDWDKDKKILFPYPFLSLIAIGIVTCMIGIGVLSNSLKISSLERIEVKALEHRKNNKEINKEITEIIKIQKKIIDVIVKNVGILNKEVISLRNQSP